MTSHFNAYFLADLKINEVENEVKSNYKEDYSQVLPVFFPIDSSIIVQNKEKLDSARELSSKAIDWHRISKWVDDSYYLIGKIDYLQSKVDDAKNAFRYVNSQSKDKDLRHLAIISLLRLYIDQKSYEEANFTIDYLSKEKEISEDNRYLLFKTLAYYYESKEDQNGVIGALDRALNFTKNSKELSRLHFILAQRYQREGLDALAYEYYKRSLDGNPSYERSFFATLFAQQVAELNASKDLKKVRNYYEDLYKDPKNKDLKDVVVYEKALFEEKQGDIPLTLQLLHQAAKEPGSNPRLKGYIYQKLADLNLNEFNDYRATKYFLDSALSFIKEDDPVSIQIKERKSTLDQYVFHVERLEKNDSLIRLASLSLEEQELWALSFIAAEEERLRKEATKKEVPKNPGIFDNLLAFSGRSSGSSFYFENGAAMQQGAIEFSRTWGNRPLQDNWRRRAALFQISGQSVAQSPKSDSLSSDVDSILSSLPTFESLLAEIPSKPEQLERINQELEESYFELGKLLFFDLKEIGLSMSNLETLIRGYPTTSKKPEAYYLLYLGQKELFGDGQFYADRLNREFPGSPFTFSVNNPDAASGNLAYMESSKRYEKAYDAYYSGSYEEARRLILSTMEEFPLTRNTEKLVLLDAMVSGKLDPVDNFKYKLEIFLANSKDPNLTELARNMLRPLLNKEDLAALDKGISTEPDSTQLKKEIQQEELRTDLPEESPYKINNSQTHIFVIALTSSEVDAAKNLLGDLETFHKQSFTASKLRTGNMNLNQGNSIYIISPFASGDKAKEYYAKFSEEFNSAGLSAEAKGKVFYISIENFQTLNRTKDLEEYLQFFKANYN